MNINVSPDELSVNNCDREPIHIPGAIQPFGTLLAGSPTLDTVTHAAANLGDHLDIAAKNALGQKFTDILPGKVLHDVRNILSYPTATTQRERVGAYEINGRDFELFAHRNGSNQAIIEIEDCQEREQSGDRAPVEQSRLFLAQAATQPDIEKFLRVAVVGLRELTGFDRVKAYRYAADGSGEVVAESRDPKAPSFFGLRYPAWDVPAQARALQVKNPVRMISDIDQEPVPVLTHQEDTEPLDMSLAHLRGISPIHVEYLQNMGVGATLTIGIVVDGKLWGMFSCHHMEARVITSDARIAAELFGQMVSLLIKERQENEQARARSDAAHARQNILAHSDAVNDLLHAFPSIAEILRELVDCDGLAVLRDDKVQTDGSVPSHEAIRAIGGYAEWDENLLENTDSLVDAKWHHGTSGFVPDLDGVAGCLIVRATAAYPLQLMFFRDEIEKTVKWAGEPKKEYGEGEFGPRITPRGSFEAYMVEQKNRSKDWSAFDMASAREIQIMLTQITAKSEREQLSRHKDLVSHQRQQDLMIAELNHRVKNILALIRSLSRQAKDSAASLESYATALEQRISALAAAHDLAVSESMRGVSLRGILDTELGPYLHAENSQAILAGPVVGLRADVAPMIALVFHEIISNAAKYGALSVTDGIVQARWSVDEDGLTFSWRELGGPEVKEPTRHGFGRSLIEKAIPYEFDGEARLDYDPSGLKFDFSLPARNLVDLDKDAEPKLATKVAEIKRVASGKTALLIEDNVVLAMDMVDSLYRLGAEHIETAATIDSGMSLVKTMDFDFAVLDMNLRGEVAFDVAIALKERGVPFIFVTGYGSKMDIPHDLERVPVLTKPVDDGTLSNGVGKILNSGERN
ncbi:HWE histidine kinase domain-containing protein [Aurantiacibacter aquimixticola]|uniref:HWE histidine kinase domain-containing protein n=1 Tax=Aurantiacibacter aquimixticola TaxID=1958945 RepID=UPI0014030C94|nr:HWE histidine kinase domain-containing protein [Aurantiacibacter aquimixticola]